MKLVSASISGSSDSGAAGMAQLLAPPVVLVCHLELCLPLGGSCPWVSSLVLPWGESVGGAEFDGGDVDYLLYF